MMFSDSASLGEIDEDQGWPSVQPPSSRNHMTVALRVHGSNAAGSAGTSTQKASGQSGFLLVAPAFGLGQTVQFVAKIIHVHVSSIPFASWMATWNEFGQLAGGSQGARVRPQAPAG